MVMMRKSGPKLPEYEVSILERRMGATLPPSYRRFLLEFNGGRPTPDGVDVKGLEDSPTDVTVFFGIGRSLECECIEWSLTALVERLEPRLVPIAGDSGGSVFCLSLRDQDYGAILYCDLQSVYGDFEATPEFYPVAPDFDTFLDSIYEFEDDLN